MSRVLMMYVFGGTVLALSFFDQGYYLFGLLALDGFRDAFLV